MRRLALALLALVLLRADMFPDASNAKLPEAQDNLSIARSVEAYGAKCDNATNDSAAFQAAITANAFGALQLPVGRCIVNGLVIAKPIRITGKGTRQSVLVSPNGSTQPVITVQLTDNGGVSIGLHLADLTITSQDRTNAPGLNNVHGIRLIATGAPVVKGNTNLMNVTIDQVPGSCLYANFDAAGMTMASNNFNCSLPSQYGVYMNSVSDWAFYGASFYGAAVHNISCSGCGYVHFYQTNSFNADQRNLTMFNANNFFWDGGSLDRARQNNVYIDNRDGGPAYFSNVTIGWAGAETDATFSDMTLSSQNTGTVFLKNTIFYDRATSPYPNKPVDNLHMTSGNTGYVYGQSVTFKAGDWLTAGVLGGITRFYRGTEPMAAWTPTLIGSTAGTAAHGTQVGNYTVSNGVVQLFGSVDSTSLAGLTGSLRIGGLPVPPVAVSRDYGGCVLPYYSGWTSSTVNSPNLAGFIAGLGAGGATSILLMRSFVTGTAPLETSVGEWAAVSRVDFSCMYRY